MADGRTSLFNSVQQIQALASTLTFNQPHSTTICWNRDLELLQYKKFQIKISRLTSGVQTMLKDLHHKMRAFSGGKPVKFTIPKDHLDDLSLTAQGES